MSPSQVWRSVVHYLIFAYIRPYRGVLKRRMETRLREEHDSQHMLNMLLMQSRTWLRSTVRVPLKSILTDPGSLGIENKRSMAGRISGAKGTTLETRMIRLKVRCKAMVTAIVKAPPPPAILSLLSLLLGDGQFFPRAGHFLFDSEIERLELDEIGATRHMLFEVERESDSETESDDDDGGGGADGGGGGGGGGGAGDDASDDGSIEIVPPPPPPPAHWEYSASRNIYLHRYMQVGIGRVEMLVTNLLFTRILIPLVILKPEKQAHGASKDQAAAIAANLRIVSTCLYMMLRKHRRELPRPGVEQDVARKEKQAGADDARDNLAEKKSNQKLSVAELLKAKAKKGDYKKREKPWERQMFVLPGSGIPAPFKPDAAAAAAADGDGEGGGGDAAATPAAGGGEQPSNDAPPPEFLSESFIDDYELASRLHAATYFDPAKDLGVDSWVDHMGTLLQKWVGSIVDALIDMEEQKFRPPTESENVAGERRRGISGMKLRRRRRRMRKRRKELAAIGRHAAAQKAAHNAEWGETKQGAPPPMPGAPKLPPPKPKPASDFL